MGCCTRVIARLDIKGPNVIKGLQFEGHRVLGTADALATAYYRAGIDEIIYQDTVASLYQRSNIAELIKRAATGIFVPIAVGGGLRSIEDMRNVLRAGADKVILNTGAVKSPSLIDAGAREFGSQCIVCSIETARINGEYKVWVDYGREVSSLDPVSWAQEVVNRGAGEIIINSLMHDGMGEGFDLDIISQIAEKVSVPVVASGGAGKREHCLDVLRSTSANAVVVGSMFHYHYLQNSTQALPQQPSHLLGGEIDQGNFDFIKDGYGGDRAIMVQPTSVQEVKTFLSENGIVVRTAISSPLPDHRVSE